MLFNSLHFLFFFPIVATVFFIVPHRWRWALLLGASYYFYMAWKAEYILLILLSTTIDYFAGLKMGSEENQFKRKLYLLLSLCSNLSILFVFKYFNFFAQTTQTVLSAMEVSARIPTFQLLLPMGISFYTFQTLSYSIDVYRRKIAPERHFGVFALYVSFFPQLVAGPIERSDRLLPQFYKKMTFNYQRITDGLKRMAWGMFKKVVIADQLAVTVNLVYNNLEDFRGLPLVLATIFFALQIYCDFSGYSDIAIGSAQVMGFDLMENFRRPYHARSISDFWSRWHISLSTWFRDYLYIPLGGNRVKLPRHLINLLITFFVSGLWHGADWTFVVWGGLHGGYLVIEKLLKPLKKLLLNRLQVRKDNKWLHFFEQIFTFGLVCLSWIFFRANNLSDAVYVLNEMTSNWRAWGQSSYVMAAFDQMGLSTYNLWTLAVSIGLLEVVQRKQRSGSIRERLSKQPLVVRWACYVGLVLAIFYLRYDGTQQFIYFQF